jgi:hypothetical protein
MSVGETRELQEVGECSGAFTQTRLRLSILEKEFFSFLMKKEDGKIEKGHFGLAYRPAPSYSCRVVRDKWL